MQDFAGKIAVVTGGGTGMGRELARALVQAGCSVAMCDVAEDTMAETRSLCEAAATAGARVTTHLADVSDEAAVLRFRDAVAAAHGKELHLLFNNAGIGGGSSFVKGPRDEWEKTFGVCFYGVYYCTRAFLPLLMAAKEAHIINTSSVNGFWASLGPSRPHVAYSTAKFAVKGFTEALITDLRMNAPHVKCSLVMPGHVGTAIVRNSRLVLTGKAMDDLTAEEIAESRKAIAAAGFDASSMSDEQVRKVQTQMARNFEENAPTSAAQAAQIILDGVRREKWRILVGKDAEALDRAVREAPEDAYGPGLGARMRESGQWLGSR